MQFLILNKHSLKPKTGNLKNAFTIYLSHNVYIDDGSGSFHHAQISFDPPPKYDCAVFVILCGFDAHNLS